MPGVVFNNWFGVSGPAKTPPDLIVRLSKELGLVAADPDFQKRLQSVAFDSAFLDADQFRAEIRDDYERFGKLIRDAGIVPQ